MNFKDYFDTVQETAQYQDFNGLAYLGLGLVGEAGEAADIIKKTLRHLDIEDFPVRSVGKRTEDLKLELGDIQWYWCNLCHELRYDPEEILQMNYDKLRKRYSV